MSKKDFDYVWTDKKRTIFGLPFIIYQIFSDRNQIYYKSRLFNLVEDELDLYTVKTKKLFYLWATEFLNAVLL